MFKTLCAVLALSLLTIAASAQLLPKGNVFIGYSYNRADVGFSDHTNLNGWEASVEGKFLPWIGLVGDVSGHYGSQNAIAPALCPFPTCPLNVSVDSSEYNFLFGPGASVSVGKIRPFAEALFGAAHIHQDLSSSLSGGGVAGASGSDTSFATALGGGIDYKLAPFIAWRVQGDYLQTRFFNTRQDDFRFSTGVVFHF